MSKNPAYNLTKNQKDAIAEQIAGFFFGFWESRQNNSGKQLTKRNGKAVTLDSGLLRNFPEKSKVTA